MDIQNHYYGHSAVLAAYAGLSRPRHVAGLLQHGWTATSPVAAHFADFPRVGRSARRRLLVWSHRSRAWNPVDEDRPTTAVGAPVLYLERLLAARGWRRSDQLGPVFVPFHGTRLVRVTGAHAELAAHVADVDGPSTVCLHSEDMTDPQIVDAWTRAGHRLVTAGRRDDPAFLLRIAHLAGNASRLSSNRLSTAVFYAAALGTPAAVWGDPLTFGAQGADAVAGLREHWPEFHGEHPDAGAATVLARAELGADALLEPGPLRDALGWARRSPGPLLQYYAASPLAKAAMVLGLTERTAASTAAMSAGGFSPWLWLRHPLAALPRPLPAGLDRPVTTREPLSADRPARVPDPAG